MYLSEIHARPGQPSDHTRLLLGDTGTPCHGVIFSAAECVFERPGDALLPFDC
jgi:hypothetical protein